MWAVARGDQVDVSSTVKSDESEDTRVVRVEGGIVQWRCVECSGWQPLAEDDCRTCGRSRRAFAQGRGRFPTADELVRPVGAMRRLLAIIVSLVLPGGGHLIAGRVVSGLLRLVIVALWVGTAGLALGRAGWDVRAGLPDLSSPVPMVVPVLLVGVALVWFVGVVDTVIMTGRRRREALGGRGLVWLVVVVTLGLLVATVIDLGPVDLRMVWA